jgi:integrase
LPRLKLSARFVDTVRPQGGCVRDEYLDVVVPQLMLRITPAGHKSYCLVARFPGSKNPTRRLLGPCFTGDPRAAMMPDPGILERHGAALTLGEARAKARLWLGMIARGIDPAAQRRAQQADAVAAHEAESRQATSRFEHVARHWLKRHAANLKHWKEIEAIVEREFITRWADRPINTIAVTDIIEAIDAIVRRGAKYQAHVSYAYLRQIFNFAIGSGSFDIAQSPLHHLRPVHLIGAKEPRDRILDAAELRKVWQAAEWLGYPWGSITQLLMLTAQRLREIADLSWSEIDLDEKLITIPKSRMKGGAAHELPLAPCAMRLIERLKHLPYQDGPYLFSFNGGRHSVAGFARPKHVLDERSWVSNWKLHDLRRTARSGFSALAGFEDHVREAVLDHRARGIRRVYDMHKYRDEKRALLTAWEARLLSIVEPGRKVVRLAGD